MQKIFIVFVLFSTFVFQASFAAEIDSVTPRKLKLENSLTTINTIFNKRMQEAIEKANVQQGDIEDIDEDEYINEGEKLFCDEEVLYNELRKAIYQSYTASWGLKGYDLDKQLRSF